MSQEYAGKDPLALAEEAERNLNSKAAQQGVGEDTATRKDPDYSGVNDAPSFPGSTLQTGAASSGREIPPEEGGDVVLETGATKASNPADNPRGATTGNVTTQRLTKADEFEGEVGEGPEAKRERYENERGGEDDVRGNVR